MSGPGPDATGRLRVADRRDHEVLTGTVSPATDIVPLGATSANANPRQLMRNFVTGYLGLAVSLGLSLFLTPLVLRHLGSSGYGLWVVLAAVGGYAGLIGLGVETAAVQEISSCIAAGDTARLEAVVATSRLFFLLSGSVAGLIVIGLLPLLGDLFRVGHSLLPEARVALVLMAVATGAAMMTNIPLSILFGAGRTDKSALFGIALAVASQGTQIAVVLLHGGLPGLFAISAAQGTIALLGLDQIARRSKLVPRARTRPSRAVLRDLLRSGRRNVTVAIGGTIAYNLDAVVIGIILPVARVAPYDLALSTAKFTRSASTAGTNLLLPTYAHSATLDDRERQFRLWSRAVLLSMAITVPMAVSLCAFGHALLHLWVGSVPPQTYEVMVALNVVLLLQLPGHQSFVFLTGVGKNAILARLTLPFALLNLGLSIGATYWLGPVGPALGSIPQVLVLDFVVLPVLCCRHCTVPVRRYLSDVLLPLTVPLLTALAAAATLVATLTDTPDWMAPLECVAICLLAWSAIVPVLIKRDPTIRGWLARLRKRA